MVLLICHQKILEDEKRTDFGGGGVGVGFDCGCGGGGDGGEGCCCFVCWFANLLVPFGGDVGEWG